MARIKKLLTKKFLEEKLLIEKLRPVAIIKRFGVSKTSLYRYLKKYKIIVPERTRVGNRYYKLLVIGRKRKLKNGHVVWQTKCDCGNITFVIGSNLKTKSQSRGIKSCGCLKLLTGPNNLNFMGSGDIKQTASLDRINSDVGYVEGNIQWVHKDVNWMKQKFPVDYFINICEKVAKNCGGGAQND